MVESEEIRVNGAHFDLDLEIVGLSAARAMAKEK
jgi:hypothetical protein